MSLRVAFDLDGVFADLGAHLDEPTGDAASASGSSHPYETTHLKRAGRDVWDRLAATSNFWESLREIEPGSLRQLAELARERRWEVIFLTSRPSTEGDTVQIQSQRWLERHGYPLPSLFVTRGSRGRIAAALSLDVVVDDNPENCLDVAMESKARAILVWRGQAEVVPENATRLGIGAVSTVVECLGLLDEADRSRGHERGFVKSLRRALGRAAGKMSS
jgi:hypothetical protein